jgi:hypothetical protein
VSGLSDARTELVAALGTHRVKQPGEPFATPCIRIHPGNPWLGPSALANGQRTQRWEVWAVAGRGAGKANYVALETLVSTITIALDNLPGWSGIVWDRPNPTDMGGTQYLAVRGTIETKKGV